MKNYYIFLDDQRYPQDVKWVELPRHNWSVIRSYDQFVSKITYNGLPKYICYDHDLGNEHYGHGLNNDNIPYEKYTEKTGYDCAKWLVKYCNENNLKHPPYLVHSLNPVGKQNIINIIDNYNKNYEQ